ncbi:MAG: FtsW/RodA/SpoVE family cell cycle protein [Eubacteriales bacterium]|nr:FtsW/RodA/SpoVE family cell cycle protein [Eubacteriales bacterium]
MQSVFIELSKYIFAFLLSFYALGAYRGAVLKNERKRKLIYVYQNILMFTIHLLGYLILYMISDDMKYVYLYFTQFIYFFIVIFVYDVLYPKASRLLVNDMCTLMAVGFIMLARLDFDSCVKQFVIAIGGTVITFFIPWLLKKVKSFRNFGWAYCMAGLILLIIVLFGNEVYGANLVMSIGGVSIQPGEFVKILYVMFVASMFNKSTTFRQTAIVTVFAALHVIILVISTDLGAALIFFVVYLMMLFVATRKTWYLLAGLGAGCVAGGLAYKLFAHVRARVIIWRDPWSTIDTSGYQICQSLFAIGMGSWFGYGLGRGMPYEIPVATKDFMFSALTEEFGIIFTMALLFICLNNLILMMNIASRCKTLFYRLVAVGLGVTYGFQVFLTVGGSIKLIPMTGVTLPFVSYGGSSIVSSLVMFALINGMYNMRQDEGGINHERAKKKKKRPE